MTEELADAEFKVDNNFSLVDEFAADLRIRGLRNKTIINYVSCLRTFFGYIQSPAANVGMSELRDFLAYLREQKLSESRINEYYVALGTFYDFLEYEGYVTRNPIKPFRKRYLANLRKNRSSTGDSRRKLISIEDMRRLINSVLDPRDKAVMILLAKTGIRRQELIDIDVDDINWEEQLIELKPTGKRSNLTVFFDDECARILKMWLQVRESRRIKEGEKALFINEQGGRLEGNGIYNAVTKYAEILGLHNPKSRSLKDRFTPHCFRHWFTTHLLRAGMPREYVKELRGDSREEAIDIYHHIDKQELREAYLAHIPELGI